MKKNKLNIELPSGRRLSLLRVDEYKYKDGEGPVVAIVVPYVGDEPSLVGGSNPMLFDTDEFRDLSEMCSNYIRSHSSDPCLSTFRLVHINVSELGFLPD